jgi:hypothetical protein
MLSGLVPKGNGGSEAGMNRALSSKRCAGWIGDNNISITVLNGAPAIGLRGTIRLQFDNKDAL